jgi:hypothetical protein
LRKQIGPLSSTSLEEVQLIPWTEYSGKIIDVRDSSITLETVYRVLIPIPTNSLNKWKDIIQKDGHIGILALDDGSIRARRMDSC